MLMSVGESSLVITLVKILNWPAHRPVDSFLFSFFSLKSGVPITAKRIRCCQELNQLHLNYSLRVSYLPDENEILLKMTVTQPATVLELGQFAINLDHLAKKKLQFFPFGKLDTVLKVAAAADSGRLPVPRPQRNQSPNDQFIRQKEEFLRRITNTSSSSLGNDNSRSKLSRRSCSEKVQDLLQEAKGLRMKHQQIGTQREFNDYYNGQSGIQRSGSETHLPLRKQIRRSAEEDWEGRSNKSQRHKLQLKNLEMLPCENEYYDEPVPTPTRKNELPRSGSTRKPNSQRPLYY